MITDDTPQIPHLDARFVHIWLLQRPWSHKTAPALLSDTEEWVGFASIRLTSSAPLLFQGSNMKINGTSNLSFIPLLLIIMFIINNFDIHSVFPHWYQQDLTKSLLLLLHSIRKFRLRFYTHFPD